MRICHMLKMRQGNTTNTNRKTVKTFSSTDEQTEQVKTNKENDEEKEAIMKQVERIDIKGKDEEKNQLDTKTKW